MRALRFFIIALGFAGMTCATTAQTTETRPKRREEVPFRLVSASVEQFQRERPSIRGPYREALVVRIEASRADYEALPPSVAAYLYIATHELRPLKFQWTAETVTVTFHDPQWRELRGGEPMVLTINHSDPLRNPEKYREYPKFDPGWIRRE
jgi:hypothetical protein